MKRFCGVLLCGLAMIVIGCKSGDTTTGGSGDNKTSSASPLTPASATAICGKCGEMAGSENCCAASADSCSCGFHKGTALCCNPGGVAPSDVKYCATCGNEKGSADCCKAGEKCDACGFLAGSTMCTAKCGQSEKENGSGG